MRYKEIRKKLIETGPATSSIGQDLGMSGHAAVAAIGRYSAEDDSLEKLNINDTRKPKVTLKMLNKLKMIRASKKLEMLQKSKLLSVMYASPPEDSGGGL